jgi:4a-hydroxytetrahydrobiopterin dehydratase
MNLHPGWKISATHLTRRYYFKNFKQAWQFVNSVGALAEEACHHPDIHFGWGYCELSLTTHDQGHTVTEKDYALAIKIDQIGA